MSEAQKIMQYLGGSRFAKGYGATNFVDGENMLVFHLKGRKTKDGINKVMIKFVSDNNYTMVFSKMSDRALRVKEVRKIFTVTKDGLMNIFEKNTGLLFG